MPDRLERVLAELQEELSRGSVEEARREQLAEWFSGVLYHERDKNTRTLNITELMRRGHGLSEAEDDETPPSPGSAA